MFFVGAEVGVFFEEEGGEGGVVEGGESADGGLVEVAHVEEFFAEGTEVIGTGVDEALEGGLAIGESGLVIEGDFLERVHGAAIAEEGGEVADEFGVFPGEGFDGGVPVFGERCFAPTFEAFVETLEDVWSFLGLGDG